jgi:D-aminoacyl-tRNA deacylase
MIATRDIDAHLLSVSQFTLLASTKKGSKPDFHSASGGEHAKTLYEAFFSKVQEGYKPEMVKDGVFQAMMVLLYRTQKIWIDLLTTF